MKRPANIVFRTMLHLISRDPFVPPNISLFPIYIYIYNYSNYNLPPTNLMDLENQKNSLKKRII